jgi:hypothetical protein
MLWELSVTEQRYRAVLEVMAGVPVTEVAERHGASRQSVHAWLRRYPNEGPSGLADRSHRVRRASLADPARGDHSFQISLDGGTISVVPHTSTREIHRYKAYPTRQAARHDSVSETDPGQVVD